MECRRLTPSPPVSPLLLSELVQGGQQEPDAHRLLPPQRHPAHQAGQDEQRGHQLREWRASSQPPAFTVDAFCYHRPLWALICAGEVQGGLRDDEGEGLHSSPRGRQLCQLQESQQNHQQRKRRRCNLIDPPHRLMLPIKPSLTQIFIS